MTWSKLKPADRKLAVCYRCEQTIERVSDGRDDRPEYVHLYSRAPHCEGSSIFADPWCWPKEEET